MKLSVFSCIAAIIAGIVGGSLCALWLAGAIGAGGAGSAYEINVDGWIGDTEIGSITANLRTRARVAQLGALGLSRQEAIYFVRDTDSDGERFHENCSYDINGEQFLARWWSITLYAEDGFLSQNEHDAHSISTFNIGETTTGNWRSIIKPSIETNAFALSSKNAGNFHLILRLYNPNPEIVDNPNKISFPDIERKECDNGGAT